MKKITISLIILAMVAFLYNNIVNYDKIKTITNDNNPQTYYNMITKNLNQETIQDYYYQVLRYINYFIFFEDINIEYLTNDNSQSEGEPND